jgi:hypothetical protein
VSRSSKRLVEVPILTPASGESGHAEVIAVEVDKAVASRAGSYWSAGYARFLETGDTSALKPFEGETIGGRPLVVDPDVIEDFYFEHGHIDFQEYYKP